MLNIEPSFLNLFLSHFSFNYKRFCFREQSVQRSLVTELFVAGTLILTRTSELEQQSYQQELILRLGSTNLSGHRFL
jgi:hypothetical protein